MDVSSDIVTAWARFLQILSPHIHSALSLFYILVSSPALRERLQLSKNYRYFRVRFLEPLRAVCHAFAADLKQNGGAGQLEAAVGEDVCHTGMIRSVDLISSILGRIEDAVGEAFVVPVAELEEPSKEDIEAEKEIRYKTAY